MKVAFGHSVSISSDGTRVAIGAPTIMSTKLWWSGYAYGGDIRIYEYQVFGNCDLDTVGNRYKWKYNKYTNTIFTVIELAFQSFITGSKVAIESIGKIKREGITTCSGF